VSYGNVHQIGNTALYRRILCPSVTILMWDPPTAIISTTSNESIALSAHCDRNTLTQHFYDFISQRHLYDVQRHNCTYGCPYVKVYIVVLWFVSIIRSGNVLVIQSTRISKRISL
jgi:hypothetical protein